MITIHTCEQGSADWFKVRAGMPTASEFHTVMAKGRDGGSSVTRRTYLLKLAGEIITGEAAESYSNAHMERGKAMEAEARERYAFDHEAEPELVGFITNGPKGCSPDSLIGSNGMLEIKTKLPHLIIECLLRDGFPPEHKAQCQGALWVAEREWIDLAPYWPKMPLRVFKAYRDEPYIKTMAEAVDAFSDELAAMVERVRAYGSVSEAARAAA
jgi:hypothetical protein